MGGVLGSFWGVSGLIQCGDTATASGVSFFSRVTGPPSRRSRPARWCRQHGSQPVGLQNGQYHYTMALTSSNLTKLMYTYPPVLSRIRQWLLFAIRQGDNAVPCITLGQAIPGSKHGQGTLHWIGAPNTKLLNSNSARSRGSAVLCIAFVSDCLQPPPPQRAICGGCLSAGPRGLAEQEHV